MQSHRALSIPLTLFAPVTFFYSARGSLHPSLLTIFVLDETKTLYQWSKEQIYKGYLMFKSGFVLQTDLTAVAVA